MLSRTRSSRMRGCRMDNNSWQMDGSVLTFMLSFVLILSSLDATMPAVATTLHLACEPSDPRMNATHELFRGQDVIWQIPPNPRSIILLFHGTAQDNFLFFDRGPGCPECYGLPESRTATLDALEQGYAVLTVYWTTEFMRWVDWPRDIAIDLVKTWTRKHSLEHLPLVGWGFSAGGYIASRLALEMPLQALVLMCSEGDVDALQLARPDTFPPTFFAYMNNTKEDSELDFTNVDDVTYAEGMLRSRGVQVFEERMFRRPVTASLFWRSIHCITEEDAEGMYAALKADGSWLDEGDYLLKDPWVDDWRTVLLQRNAIPYCEGFGDLCLAEHVEEVLRVAAAIHAFSRHPNPQIFSWLNSVLSTLDAVHATQ